MRNVSRHSTDWTNIHRKIVLSPIASDVRRKENASSAQQEMRSSSKAGMNGWTSSNPERDGSSQFSANSQPSTARRHPVIRPLGESFVACSGASIRQDNPRVLNRRNRIMQTRTIRVLLSLEGSISAKDLRLAAMHFAGLAEKRSGIFSQGL